MEIFDAIAKSPLPTIFGIGGIVFLFLALVGVVRDALIIDIPAPRQKMFAVSGAFLLLAGASLYVLLRILKGDQGLPLPGGIWEKGCIDTEERLSKPMGATIR